MKIVRTFLILTAFCFCACNCTDKGQDTPTGGEDNKQEQVEQADPVTVYVTTADAKTLFKRSTLKFSDTNVLDSYNIRYDKTQLGNEIDGFGLAVTTATCYNLMHMSQEDRTKFLTEMFSPTEGVGSSLIRVSIGASDFCLKTEYT